MPLSNQQFRNILKRQQIALPSQSDAFVSANDGLTSEEKKKRGKERREKKAARARAYKEKLRLRQAEKEDREKHKAKYRDRAAELREGKSIDYQDVGIDFENMDYDTSKFLGGDVKHTHMVKGLDFILLNRVRTSIDQEKEALRESRAENEEMKKKREEEKKAREAERKRREQPWKTRFARDILEKVAPERVLGSISNAKCETFWPGRMIYLFNKELNDPAPLPKVILRAKQECPDPFELNPVTVPHHLLKGIKSAMKSKKGRKSGKRKRKAKKKVHLPPAKRRKTEEPKSSPKVKSSKKHTSSSGTKRKADTMDRFDSKRKRTEKRSSRKEEKNEHNPDMDIDIFAGEGDYDTNFVPPPKEPVAPKTKVPLTPFDDVFGLGGLSSTIKDELESTQAMRRFDEREERKMTQKQYQRQLERQADKEWKQIQNMWKSTKV